MKTLLKKIAAQVFKSPFGGTNGQRKLIRGLLLLLFATNLFAQAPQKLSYQAVVRTTNNALVTNKTVGMRISILQGTVLKYIEFQTPTTNANGLVTIQVGAGVPDLGTFAAIDWSGGNYFIETEIDPTGGTNYTIDLTSQLLSVPYALYADKAGSVSYTTLTNKPTTLDEDKTDDVLLTGNQTIAGNKTFTGTTTVATPINNTDAATKAYVDAVNARAKVIEDNIILTNWVYTDPRDGYKYKVVKIGNQVWMAENLRYLPSVAGYATGSETTPYYYVYGYNGTDVTAAKATDIYKTYGVLYNWAAANIACPPGWHLPTDAEWTQLTDYLDGEAVAGGKLKETLTTYWKSPNTDATNSSGFTALPGGARYNYGGFGNFNNVGYWWSATSIRISSAWYRGLSYDNNSVADDNINKGSGFSVRCVRD